MGNPGRRCQITALVWYKLFLIYFHLVYYGIFRELYLWHHIMFIPSSILCLYMPIHDDIMPWKHFLHYWLFVRGIHQSLVDSPHRGPVMHSIGVFFAINPNKLLNKWSSCWRFQMSWHSYDTTVMSSTNDLWVVTIAYHLPENCMWTACYCCEEIKPPKRKKLTGHQPPNLAWT